MTERRKWWMLLDREDREDNRRTTGGTAVRHHSTHSIFRPGALAGGDWRVKTEGGNQKNVNIMTVPVVPPPPPQTPPPAGKQWPSHVFI